MKKSKTRSTYYLKNTIVGEPEGTVECIDFDWNYEDPVFEEIDMRSWFGLYIRLFKLEPMVFIFSLFTAFLILLYLFMAVSMFFVIPIVFMIEVIKYVNYKVDEVLKSNQGDKQ